MHCIICIFIKYEQFAPDSAFHGSQQTDANNVQGLEKPGDCQQAVSADCQAVSADCQAVSADCQAVRADFQQGDYFVE